MVLVDTSVWVSHLRENNMPLVDLLDDAHVACHPFIIGELACGNLRNRVTIISLLENLPMALSVDHHEVIRFIENHKLQGQGLGYIDVHLLASAVLTGFSLWTFDKKLKQFSGKLNCMYKE